MSLQLVSQDTEPYVMFESIILSPSPKTIPTFSQKMAIHNKTFHATGPYEAAVYNIVTGPNVGKVVWMMGPCTFTDLDNRPKGSAHDSDWAGNVVPLLNGAEHAEYWKRDDKLSLPITRQTPYPLYYIRIVDVEKGQSYKVDALLEKLSAAVKSDPDQTNWSIFDNLFFQGYKTGRHIAFVTGMLTWSELDKDGKFAKVYNKIHGENSFNNFQKEWTEIFSDTYDEIWSYDAEMSGK